MIAPGLGTWARQDDVLALLAEFEPLVIDPVVDLELDPGGRQNIERLRRNECIAGQELTADKDRIWVIELVRLVHRPHVPAKGRSDTAHIVIGEIVEGAVVSARSSGGFGDGDWHRIGLRRHRIRLGIDQIHLAQHAAQRGQIEQGNRGRQAIPRYEPVEQGERHPGDANGDHVMQWWLLAKPVAQAVRRACSIGLFAGTIHVAERPELVGCVPRIERQLVHEALHRPPLRTVDVLLRERQSCDQDRPADLFLPPGRKILDRRRPLADEGLQVEIEGDVAAAQSPCHLLTQIVGCS